jgi:hypothetical protein
MKKLSLFSRIFAACSFIGAALCMQFSAPDWALIAIAIAVAVCVIVSVIITEKLKRQSVEP